MYLTASDPKGFTSDNFLDLKTLRLEPHLSEAMERAFNPLGVYLNFWHDKMSAGEARYYTVAMVNDEDRPRAGKLRLSFKDAEGRERSATEIPFAIGPLGAQSYNLKLESPDTPGLYSLQATAAPRDDPEHPTTSKRSVTLAGASGAAGHD